MADYVTASNGVQLELAAIEQSFVYDGTFVSTITVVFSGKTYIQTFENDGTNITDISQWVVQ
jgi:hypothetical protein